jgi:hypothetical protein
MLARFLIVDDHNICAHTKHVLHSNVTGKTKEFVIAQASKGLNPSAIFANQKFDDGSPVMSRKAISSLKSRSAEKKHMEVTYKNDEFLIKVSNKWPCMYNNLLT